MPKWYVGVREIWEQGYIVEAPDREEALIKVRDGRSLLVDGEAVDALRDCETNFEYAETLDWGEWIAHWEGE